MPLPVFHPNKAYSFIRVPSLEPASMVCPTLAASKGWSAYTYDASTSTCVLGMGTCVRAAAADTDKDVVNVANVVGKCTTPQATRTDFVQRPAAEKREKREQQNNNC